MQRTGWSGILRVGGGVGVGTWIPTFRKVGEASLRMAARGSADVCGDE